MTRPCTNPRHRTRSQHVRGGDVTRRPLTRWTSSGASVPTWGLSPATVLGRRPAGTIASTGSCPPAGTPCR
jgi:hypothetical protein